MERKKLIREESALEIYLKEIGKYPLLTREEEKYYVIRMKNGDKSAKDKLIKSNLRFVVHIAKYYQNRNLSLLDLISEGNIGLMRAADKFEIAKNCHFVSYAVWWIRQKILRVIGTDRMIHLSKNKFDKLRKINKLYEESSLPNGVILDIKNIAKYLGFETDIVKELIQFSYGPSSLDKICGDEEADPPINFVKDYDLRPEELAINNSLKRDINDLLNKVLLKKREKEVLEYRFGLNGKPELTLEEVGNIYNLTRERIRQIEGKAINRLRKTKNKEKIAAYLD